MSASRGGGMRNPRRRRGGVLTPEEETAYLRTKRLIDALRETITQHGTAVPDPDPRDAIMALTHVHAQLVAAAADLMSRQDAARLLLHAVSGFADALNDAVWPSIDEDESVRE
jgi:hypothetical protein